MNDLTDLYDLTDTSGYAVQIDRRRVIRAEEWDTGQGPVLAIYSRPGVQTESAEIEEEVAEVPSTDRVKAWLGKLITKIGRRP